MSVACRPRRGRWRRARRASRWRRGRRWQAAAIDEHGVDAVRRAVGRRRRLHDRLMRADNTALGQPGEPCTATGDPEGCTILVRTTSRGFKRRELTLRATVYSW